MAFHKTAKQQVCNFRTSNKVWIQQFCDELCLLDPTATTTRKNKNGKRKPPSFQQLLKLYQPPPQDYYAVRGLHIDTCLIEHRRLHCQRVLLIQEKLRLRSSSSSCSSSSSSGAVVVPSQEQREKILRSTSIQTSKSSKTIARWFAHYDYMDMISLIRQELSTSCC